VLNSLEEGTRLEPTNSCFDMSYWIGKQEIDIAKMVAILRGSPYHPLVVLSGGGCHHAAPAMRSCASGSSSQREPRIHFALTRGTVSSPKLRVYHEVRQTPHSCSLSLSHSLQPTPPQRTKQHTRTPHFTIAPFHVVLRRRRTRCRHDSWPTVIRRLWKKSSKRRHGSIWRKRCRCITTYRLLTSSTMMSSLSHLRTHLTIPPHPTAQVSSRAGVHTLRLPHMFKNEEFGAVGGFHLFSLTPPQDFGKSKKEIVAWLQRYADIPDGVASSSLLRLSHTNEDRRLYLLQVRWRRSEVLTRRRGPSCTPRAATRPLRNCSGNHNKTPCPRTNFTVDLWSATCVSLSSVCLQRVVSLSC